LEFGAYSALCEYFPLDTYKFSQEPAAGESLEYIGTGYRAGIFYEISRGWGVGLSTGSSKYTKFTTAGNEQDLGREFEVLSYGGALFVRY